MELDTSKTITVLGVQVYDITSREIYGHSDSEAEWVITCAWADRIALIESILGKRSGNGAISEVLASAQYPDAPSLRGYSVAVEGVGLPSVGSNGKIAWDLAQLTVTFKVPNFGITGGGVGSMQITFGGDVLSCPQDVSSFKWLSDDEDLPPEASPNLQITTATIRVPQTRLPSLIARTGGIMNLVDHVNGSQIFGAEEGHVLYKGADSLARPLPTRDAAIGTSAADGLEAYDLMHLFLWRSKPWNQFFRPSTGVWEDIVNKATDEPYFPEGNLNSILDQLGIQPGAGIVRD